MAGSPELQSIKIPVGDQSVSGLLLRPARAKALYLFAHGAGVGMTHASMESNAQGLAQRGIATLRYQFPYMEQGSKRPDPPRLAQATVRAAAAQTGALAPDLPLYAGGRLLGLGLWNHRWLTIVIEVTMFFIAIWTYQRQTRAKNKIGQYGFWAFILFLLITYGLAAFGPPPPSVRAIAVGTLFSWLFVPWAWWFDRHREPRSNV